jgi:putative hemolysin
MVMLLLGRVPRTADAAEWQGWRFEIVDMDKHRVDKVLASRMPEQPRSSDDDQDRGDATAELPR